MIDAAADHLAAIRRILNEHLPSAKIKVFGSRIAGKAKPYSDLDIALECDTAISPVTLSAIREELQESDVPFRVDIADWNRISPEFRQVITAKFELL